MSYAVAAWCIGLMAFSFIAGGFLEWDSARAKIKSLEVDNRDLERALFLSYQENETMREILLSHTSSRQEK